MFTFLLATFSSLCRDQGHVHWSWAWHQDVPLSAVVAMSSEWYTVTAIIRQAVGHHIGHAPYDIAWWLIKDQRQGLER